MKKVWKFLYKILTKYKKIIKNDKNLIYLLAIYIKFKFMKNIR